MAVAAFLLVVVAFATLVLSFLTPLGLYVASLGAACALAAFALGVMGRASARRTLARVSYVLAAVWFAGGGVASIWLASSEPASGPVAADVEVAAGSASHQSTR
jgi:uncharacterized protein YqfA (UPF0365 family)